MAAVLRIHVQADRLPDVEAGAQLALRVSAAVEAGGAALDADALAEILPWQWMSQDRSAPWDPHDPASWVMYRITDDAGQPALHPLDTGVVISRVITPPATFDTDGRFRSRVAEEIGTITRAGGLEAAVSWPGDGAEVSARTAFGFVESLTALPSPVAISLNCMTVLALSAPPAATERLVALPRLAPATKGAYTDPVPDPSSLAWSGVAADLAADPGAEQPVFPSARVHVHASLAATALPASADDNRLLDLERMVVVKPSSGTGLEDEDWATSLPKRITDALDPSARVMGVLDEAVLEALDGADGPALREAMVHDLKGASPRLLTAFDAIVWEVAGARSVASPVADPAALAWLEGLGERGASWRDVLGQIVGNANACAGQDWGLPPRPGRARFAALSRKRLASLVGLPPDAFPDPVQGAASESRSLEADEGWREFIVRHWLQADEPGTTCPLAVGQPRVVAAALFAVPPERAGVGAAAAGAEASALLDMRRIRSTADLEMALTPPAHDFTLVISIEAPAGTGRPSAPPITLTATGTGRTLTLSVGTTAAPPIDAATDVRVQVSLVWAQSGGAPTVALKATIRAGGAEAATDAVDVTAALLSGPVFLRLDTTGSDLQHIAPVRRAPSPELRRALERSLSAAGVRSDLALAFIGRFLPGLLAGRTTWDAPQPENERVAAQSQPLATRLVASAAALVSVPDEPGQAPAASLYGDLLERALRAAGLPDPATAPGTDPEEQAPHRLAVLLRAVLARAAREAVRRIREIIPPARTGHDLSRRLTVEAPPLVFRIDQLQSFDAGTDLWSRLAGLGVLIARTEHLGEDPDGWWSLNAATLHVPAPGKVREPLSEDNAVRVSGPWPNGALVDPVPLQIGEQAGVRAAMISYDNRSLVAEMPSDADLPPGAEAELAQRRIEAYGFPPKGAKAFLPALSFGFAYHVVPYVLGHGATLPPFLRATPADPIRLHPREPDGRLRIAEDVADVRRSALYRRTRAIGTPRMVDSRGLGVPSGVEPLAPELPTRPPAVTVGEVVQGRFFLTTDGRRGTIDIPTLPQGQSAGLRIEFAIADRRGGGSGSLSVRLVGRKADDPVVMPLAGFEVPDDAARVRIEVLAQGSRVLTAPEPPWAEDEPNYREQMVADTFHDIAAWRDVRIDLAAAAGREADVEPPSVVVIVREGEPPSAVDNGPDKAPAVGTVVERGKPQLAPEASRPGQITVLDGISPARPSLRAAEIRVRPPAVDFGNYERWINPPLFTAGNPGRRHVEVALNTAYDLSPSGRKDNAAGSASLDDPAINGLYAELVRTFPTREVFPMLRLGGNWTTLEEILGFDANGAPVDGRERRIRTRVVGPNDTEGLASEADGPAAVLVPGSIYELRLYAGAPARQEPLCDFTRDQRLSQAVRATMRRCPIDPDVSLAPPLVLTFEVATERMPEVFSADRRTRECLDVLALRPPERATDQASIGLARAIVGQAEAYPALRYCASATLLSQRWSWRGRPQGDEGLGGDPELFLAKAFSDRRSDDVGTILERRLDRSQAYGGYDRRDQLSDTGSPPRPVPRLFAKDLDWRAGVNAWRFGVKLTSRYAALRPADPRLMVTSHRTDRGDRWQNALVPDRPNGRQVKRPGLAIVLPLTEPLSPHGPVPPLLALFDDTFYANFNLAEEIEASVEVARHPFTRLERLRVRIADIADRLEEIERESGSTTDEDELARLESEREQLRTEADAASAEITQIEADGGARALKYWQERAPDPIRTGAAADHRPVALRLDGPIGYTFDLDAEAGRFDHAGLLISPVTPTAAPVAPWSFVKLRFRRSELPEGIDPHAALTGEGLAPRALSPSGGWTRRPVPSGSMVARLANSRALSAMHGPRTSGELHPTIAGVHVFPTEHEGLMLDVPEAAALTGTATMVFSFHARDANGNERPNRDQVTVACRRECQGESCTVSFAFATHLGSAGEWSMQVARNAALSVRFVLSAREKPEKGASHRPAGDVAVRIRISGGSNATTDEPLLDRWLTLVCVPLTSQIEVPIGDPTEIRISGDWPPAANALLRPVRLSTFTPAVWCQFAESMSVFAAQVAGSQEAVIVSSDELTATVTDKGTAVIVGIQGDRELTSLAAVATPELSASSQLEEVLVLVLTRYVRDGFAQVREKPVAIVPWQAGSTTADVALPHWPPRPVVNGKPTPLTPADIGEAGRIRFMRLLRPRTHAEGGFAGATPKFPDDYFAWEMLGDGTNMNPPDAKGVVLGISNPIAWERQDS